MSAFIGRRSWWKTRKGQKPRKNEDRRKQKEKRRRDGGGKKEIRVYGNYRRQMKRPRKLSRA